MRNIKGVTIVELLIVIVVMGVISAFAVVSISKILTSVNRNVDELTVDSLNVATSYYSFYNIERPIFQEESTDAEKISLLYTEGYMDKLATTKSENASFEWDEETLVWRLNIDGTVISLSPYGDTYLEIAPKIIIDMQNKLNSTGSYGRSWGDYVYTDIGLDPDDWDEPILHIKYRPNGSKLIMELESGYECTVYNNSGDRFFMKSSYHWNLIYDDITKLWYFHIVSAENVIDIDTLVVERS